MCDSFSLPFWRANYHHFLPHPSIRHANFKRSVEELGLNINSASREELQQAFEVDGQRAEYIVQKRNELGGFESWEQFKKVVPGFEDKMVENLERAGVTLGGRHSKATGSREADSSTGNESHQKNGRQHSIAQPNREAKSSARDINEASEEDLQRVFQIDGERAHYLVQKRNEMGGFQSWDDIKREVPSFEDKMIENLEKAGFRLNRGDKAA